MAYLILIRHGKSKWNELGLWTGHTEVELNDDGKNEAVRAGESIKDITVHKVHVSSMIRAQQTWEHIKEVLGLHTLSHKNHDALKERHYGVYTGKNKWEVAKEIGEEEFQKIRRGWDVHIPEGESLKDVYDRVSKYYDENIEPEIKSGHNVLVVAHGNSLRALAKHVENLSEEEVVKLEIGTGEIFCYHMNEEAKVVQKEIRSANANTGKI